jgi:very-short-patch-repair endonuclease
MRTCHRTIRGSANVVASKFPHPNPLDRSRLPVLRDLSASLHVTAAGEGKFTRNRLLHRHARRLRNDSTDTERFLWRYLRRRSLQGYRFRRQVPIAGYIADFACLEAKVVIEIDGGQHQEQRQKDMTRDRRVQAKGFTVLRFWDHDVLQETRAVLEEIDRVLKLRAPSPPPLAGEGREGAHSAAD